jgi:high-affinity nickel-transport protein
LIVTARLYRWSADRPERRSRYNAALLSLSVAVAFVVGTVGTVGLCGVLVDSAGIQWAPVQTIAATNLDSFGLIIVAVLLLTGLTTWILARSRRTAAA